MVGIRNKMGMGLSVLLSCFLLQCGGAEQITSSYSDNNTNTGTQGSFENAFGEDIQTLQFETGSNEITVDQSKDAILVLFSANETTSQNSFGIGGSINSSAAKSLHNDVDDDDADLTSKFHNQLREAEKDVDENYTVSNDSNLSYALKSLSVGDQKSFKVLSSFSNSNSYETVSAELRVQNQYFNIYVDVRDGEAFSADDLQKIADDFLSVIHDERDIFGVESDVNGDGRFDILFSHVVNSLGGSQGGIVTGFFYAMDLFDAKKYPVSNEEEVIFVMVPDPNGDYGVPVSTSFTINNIIKGVLPHEYQHMISFNMHYFENGGLTEKSWLNEGLSHLAEDLTTLDGNDDLTGFGLENPSRVASYLSNISNNCFTCGTSLSQRGGIYLFLKYLYEQAQEGAFPNVEGGRDMLQKLLDTSNRGIPNITTALYGDEANADSFKELMGLFSLALYYSDSGLSSDNRFQIQGLDLRGSVDDNRGTFLNGPAVQSVSDFPFVDTLQGAGITYIKIPSNQLQQYDGVFEFNLSSGSDFGGFVIQ